MEPLGTLANRFRLDLQVAEGGMGTVYHAWDLASQQPLAVKVLKAHAVRDVLRFRREAALLARLNHPHLVRYVAHGTAEDGREYLAMEWVEGPTLAEQLGTDGASARESVEVALAVADGLEALHRAGAVHRDVKPGNIILPKGRFSGAKLLDLGLALRGDQPALTRTGYVMGTYGYLAPEQAKGARELDGRTDLFALGCVLYECLTGAPSFVGPGELGLRAKLLLWDPPEVRTRAPEVSPELSALVAKLLAKDPGARPGSAHEAAEALRALSERPGPRRRSELAGPVGTGGLAAPAFVLLVGTTHSGELPLDAEERLKATPEATRFGLIGDGWLAVMLQRQGPLEGLALRAAAAALELRSIFVEEPMVLVGGEPRAGSGLSTTIDRGVVLATRESRRVLYADLRPELATGAIRLDEAAAAALRGHLPLEERDGEVYLVPARPA